jgi:hypothetical protein
MFLLWWCPYEIQKEMGSPPFYQHRLLSIVFVPYATLLYIRGWMQMVLLPYDLFSWNKAKRDGKIFEYGAMNVITIYIQNGIIHSDYILSARWVLLVMSDSSSSPSGRSMRVLPSPLLLINCLSCSPHGGPGPPPFPLPGLTPFPSGSRYLSASSSATVLTPVRIRWTVHLRQFCPIP